jgi:hypothetical protein
MAAVKIEKMIFVPPAISYAHNIKEKNEITASKIKQQSLHFFIINVGRLK